MPLRPDCWCWLRYGRLVRISQPHYPGARMRLLAALPFIILALPLRADVKDAAVRVGAASVELEADDDMVIGGGILPYKVKGQEAPLRASAVVTEKPEAGKLALIACDVL